MHFLLLSAALTVAINANAGRRVHEVLPDAGHLEGVLSAEVSANPAAADEDFAALLTQSAQAWLAQNHADYPDAEQLADAIQTVVGAQISGRFETHESLMLQLGGTLGTRAENYVAYQRRYAFASIPESQWNALADTRAKAASIFADLTARRSEWTAPAAASARFGTVYAIGIEDRANAVVGQGSIFESDRFPILLNQASDGSAKVFWVRLPVRFGSQDAIDVRIDFVYDDASKVWIPTAMMTIGTTTTGRQVLML